MTDDPAEIVPRVLEALDTWAVSAGGDTYVFGSILNAPGVFDPQVSDVDLLVIASAESATADTRLEQAKWLRPLLGDLEDSLLKVLHRENANRPILSTLLVTADEILRNIHKGGSRDFFSSNTFRRLGADNTERQLCTSPGQPHEVAESVQKQRNKYLATSANRAHAWPAYDGEETIPKDLARCAAIARSFVDGSDKTTHLDQGLRFVFRSLEQHASELAESALELVLRRANSGRGSRPAIPPETMLFLWELLHDAAFKRVGTSPHARNTWTAQTHQNRRHTHRSTLEEFAVAAAEGLAATAPEALVNIAQSFDSPVSLQPVSHSIAEAYWRLHDVAGTKAWAKLPPDDVTFLSVQEATSVRLLSWAHWESDSHTEALNLLERYVSKVVDPGERARWADQRATFIRLSEPDRWDESESLYHQSLALRTPDDHLGRAMTMQNLAFLHIEHGLLDQAYRFMKRTAEHGRNTEYRGASVSLVIGELGMAWLDLLKGHPIYSARANAHIKATGLALRRGTDGIPKELRSTAKALAYLLRWRRGYKATPALTLSEAFWSCLIVKQVEVANGGDPSRAAQTLLEKFPRPKLSSARLAFVVSLLHPNTELPDTHDTDTLGTPAPWPLNQLAALGRSSTLGAIQALEQVLLLYHHISSALSATTSDDVVNTSVQGRLNSLRQLAKEMPPELADELERIAGIVDEARPARNRLVHGNTRREDEDMVKLAHQLVIDEATLLRQLRLERRGAGFVGSIGQHEFDATTFVAEHDGKAALVLSDGVRFEQEE